jgi:hypothetical protein
VRSQPRSQVRQRRRRMRMRQRWAGARVPSQPLRRAARELEQQRARPARPCRGQVRQDAGHSDRAQGRLLASGPAVERRMRKGL